MISAPNKVDKVFKVELDEKSDNGFKGLPKEFEEFMKIFSK